MHTLNSQVATILTGLTTTGGAAGIFALHYLARFSGKVVGKLIGLAMLILAASLILVVVAYHSGSPAVVAGVNNFAGVLVGFLPQP